jgi:hypothetical protein
MALRCLLALFHWECGGSYIFMEGSYKTTIPDLGTLIPVFSFLFSTGCVTTDRKIHVIQSCAICTGQCL